MSIANFSRDFEFTPQEVAAPRDEQELLALLARRPAGPVRVVGARHSWSRLLETSGLLVDLRRFDQVRVERDVAGGVTAEVGAGVRIHQLLRVLDAQGLTMPSVGLVSEQTLVGAAATGTHGSGRHSLSHYVEAVRIVSLDPDGTPRARTITAGDELRAARCHLGALGVVVWVRIRCVPQYLVEERIERAASFDEVLAGEAEWPLQQSYLIPHHDAYLVQRRRVATAPRPSRLARLYRWYWTLFIDLGLHLAVKLTASWLRSRLAVRLFFRHALPRLVIRGWNVVDRSDRMLIMEHEWFRHLELETFVPASAAPAALRLVEQLIGVAAGRATPSDELRQQFAEVGLEEQLDAIRGVFTHHYVVCVRKVLGDDTLLSMSSGDDPWYAISLITYVRPRGPFLAFAELVAECLRRRHGARPHWGKHLPGAWTVEQYRPLFPQWSEFQRFRDHHVDNELLRRALGEEMGGG